jgi:hypothetical protein
VYDSTRQAAPVGPAMTRREWLSLVYADRPGYVVVGYAGPQAGPNGFRRNAFSSNDLGHVSDVIGQLDADPSTTGVYCRTTTLATPGRQGDGSAAHSHWFTGLYADLDFGSTGHLHNSERHAGRDLPPTLADALSVVASSGLPTPTLVEHSGGGIYPRWLTTPEDSRITDPQHVGQVAARWQRVIKAATEALGWHYGAGVGDLARVLRAMDTTNRKDPEHPRPAYVLDVSGVLYRPAELLAALQAAEARYGLAGTDTRTEARKPLSGGSKPQPGQGVADRFATDTSWDDLLIGRHGWTRDRDCSCPGSVAAYVRPGGATHGHSAHVLRVGSDGEVLVAFSEECGLPTGEGHRLTKFRTLAHLEHSGDESAAAAALHAHYGTDFTPETGDSSVKGAAGQPANRKSSRPGDPRRALAGIVRRLQQAGPDDLALLGWAARKGAEVAPLAGVTTGQLLRALTVAARAAGMPADATDLTLSTLTKDR